MRRVPPLFARAVSCFEPVAFPTRTAWSWSQLSPSYRSSRDRHSHTAVGDRDLNTEVILYEGCRDALSPYAIDSETDLLRPVFTADEAVRVSELGTVIDQYVQKNMAQSVTGQIDPEGGWEAFQEQLKSLGVDWYLDLYLAAYDRAES